MEIIEQYEAQIPCWAICAIEYRDYSGLTDEDAKILDEWKASLKKDGLFWDVTFSCDCNEFCSCPEFGLPCSTCKSTIYYFKEN